MSDKADSLAQKLMLEGEKTLEFFGQIPERVWEKRLYTDGNAWYVKDVLAHLVEVEESLPNLFAAIVNGSAGVDENFDLNEYNEQAVNRMRAASVSDLLELFRERRKATVSFVKSLSENDLQKVGRHPFLGEAPIEEMLRLFYLHVNLHLRDVRKALE